jgi:predicted ferric reductase
MEGSDIRGRTMRSGRRLLFTGIYYLLAAFPAIVLFWWRREPDSAFVYVLARTCGLVGLSMLILQVFTGSRLRILDRVFGLDVVLRFHKAASIVAGLLVLAHPFLLLVDYGVASLFSFQAAPAVRWGQVGFVLLTVVIVSALARRMLRIPYHIWRVFHKGAVLVAVVGVVHAVHVGFSIRSYPELAVYYGIIGLGAALVFLWRNVPGIPRQLGFRVVSVTREMPVDWTLSLEALKGLPLVHKPGQFLFLILIRSGRRSDEHPFTIASCSVGGAGLAVTIRESGDFTNTIGRTEPGDTALVEGPFGRFSYVMDEPASLLFIAGGIGITPIMSMLRHLKLRNDSRPAVLLYANRSEERIAFVRELADMPENVKAVHVLSEAGEGWRGERGYVDAECIRKYASGIIAGAHAYVCGPPVMMSKIRKSLLDLGMSKRCIHSERFSF